MASTDDIVGKNLNTELGRWLHFVYFPQLTTITYSSKEVIFQRHNTSFFFLRLRKSLMKFTMIFYVHLLAVWNFNIRLTSKRLLLFFTFFFHFYFVQAHRNLILSLSEPPDVFITARFNIRETWNRLKYFLILFKKIFLG